MGKFEETLDDTGLGTGPAEQAPGPEIDITQPEPVVPPTPAAEQKDKSQKPPAPNWDEKRQQADQEHANERKQLLSQIESLQGERQGLQIQLDQKRTQEGKSAAEPADEILGQKLDPESGYQELLDQFHALVGLVKNHRQELGTLKQTVQNVSTSQVADADVRAEGQMLQTLNAEFGAQFQNPAQEAAIQFLAKQGYSQQSPPNRNETWMALRLAYMTLAQKSKSRPGSTPPSPRVPLDTGQGGGAQTTPAFEGSVDDVVADMKNKL